MGRFSELARAPAEQWFPLIELPKEERAIQWLELLVHDTRTVFGASVDDPDYALDPEHRSHLHMIYKCLIAEELLKEKKVDANFAKKLLKKYRGAMNQDHFYSAYAAIRTLVNPNISMHDTVDS